MAEQPVVAVSEADALAEIRRVLSVELGVTQPVTPETELLQTLALDSVQIITLVVGLEDRYRIKLDEQDAADVRTVGQLAARVVARVAERGAPAGTPVEKSTPEAR